MRLDADWMVRADDRILEYLAAEGPGAPGKIAADGRVRFGKEYIGRRLRNYLTPAGLTTNVGQGVYMLTNAGSDYLAGELDARELPDPTE